MRRLVPLFALLIALLGAAIWLVVSGGEREDGTDGAQSTLVPVERTIDATAGERTDKRTRIRSAAGADAADERGPVDLDQEIDAFALRFVTVGDERPIRGLVVDVVDAPGRAIRTDAEGVAVIDPQEGETRLSVTTRAPGAELIELVRELRVVHVPTPVPVDVHYVDAETGDTIDAGSRGVADGDLFPVWAGQDFDFRFPPFRAPSGYSTPTGSQRRRRGKLSPFAQRAIATVPVARQAKIRIQVVNEHGLVVPKATATVAMLTGAVTAVSTNNDGEALVEIMPFHRGEFVYAAARYKTAGGKAKPVALVDPSEETRIQILLNAESRGFRPPRPAEEVREDTFELEPGGDPGGNGVIVVRVRRRDGTRASRAVVEIDGPWTFSQAAEEDGTVRFDRLPAGKYRISCTEIGMNPAWDTIELGIAEDRTVDLNEPRGRTLKVQVVDTGGISLPSARVELGTPGGTKWTRMEGGDQHLDVFTDGLGEVTLFDVPEGRVPIVVSYGSRSAQAEAGTDPTIVVTVPDATVD